MTSTDPLFEVAGLQAWYQPGTPVLQDVSLDVARGEVVGLLGSNGAGKTTLLMSICGVHRKTTHRGFCFAGSPTSPGDEQFKLHRYLSLADDSSFPTWTLPSLIGFLDRAYRTPHDDARLDGLIEGFSFSQFVTTPFNRLSSGTRKKANLIAAFYLPVPLVLLDEPVDFLDFSATEFLYQCLRRVASQGRSAILSSHVAESFTRCTTRIFVLSDGVTAQSVPTPRSSTDVAALLR